MTDETKPLSKKHQRFVAEYLKCFNGTRAYMAVYKNASYETAMANASDLLRITKISDEIDKYKNMVLMQADEALKLQRDIADGDIGDLLDDNGLLDIRLAKASGKTRLLKKIKQKTITHIGKTEEEGDTEIHEIEFEMYPADVAQERILKIHGKFIDHKDITSGGKPLNWKDFINADSSDPETDRE